eukprot:COSAG01_NODE_52088_length_349_cov_0.848000_1_plen_55_part_10
MALVAAVHAPPPPLVAVAGTAQKHCHHLQQEEVVAACQPSVQRDRRACGSCALEP